MKIFHGVVSEIWPLMDRGKDRRTYVRASEAISQKLLRGISSYLTFIIQANMAWCPPGIIMVAPPSVRFWNLTDKMVSDHYLMNCFMDSSEIFVGASSYDSSELISVPAYLP